MAIYRTYIDKNNTIQSNSEINTGLNPVSELYYGNGYSRFIFYLDFSEIKQYINDYIINPNKYIKHILRLKNTSHFDIAPYLNENNNLQFNNMDRATSFDLELVPFYEFWDEGNGYDFEYNDSFKTVASNWFNRTTTNKWNIEGIVSGDTSNKAIATQHFDRGNEDIEMDITNFIQNIISGNTYQGFILKFPYDYETKNIYKRQYVGFFTRHTQTFFTPHIETQYDDVIKDDRNFFINGQKNKLYFFSHKNGNSVNLDQIPKCFIGNTEYSVIHDQLGAYYIEVTGNDFESYTEYYDTWTNLFLNNIKLSDQELQFVPLPISEYYGLGTDIYEPKMYSFNVYGIKYDETLKAGETRKIITEVREPYSVNRMVFYDGLYYRLYILQGPNEVDIIDWTEISRAYTQNYFMLNTKWMIPQTYYVDIMVKNNGETNIYNKQLKFHIVSHFNY